MVLCKFHTEFEDGKGDYDFYIAAETRAQCEALAEEAMYQELGTNDKWHGPDFVINSDERGLFVKLAERIAPAPPKKKVGRPTNAQREARERNRLGYRILKGEDQ